MNKNDKSPYDSLLERKNHIIKKAVGVDYEKFETGGISFDYDKLMEEVGYSLEDIIKIQRESAVGNTPLIELKNITKLVRKHSENGKGARIFLKDEACNPSGSFKERRAAVSVYQAKKLGYKGVIAATSGNYGAAVASQAAMHGLKCIIIQECYDSKMVGQPEIIEKARKCEAYGAEVIQLSVGPELFYVLLKLLEETGYFNASLYSPYGVAGVETLGYEVAKQCKDMVGKFPDYIICTNAGGGNLTGTARGLIKAGAKKTKVIGASVSLKGLHMASDTDFNRKSFTTGHSGFGIPFMTLPDRSDMPRSAARPLRYIDRYLGVTQGEVFYITEALAQVEGLERGAAGNTSLAAACALCKELPEDDIVVVQESEYTGAGKHTLSQLTFAKKNGIQIIKNSGKLHYELENRNATNDEICMESKEKLEEPGKNIIIPKNIGDIHIKEYDLDGIKRALISNEVKRAKSYFQWLKKEYENNEEIREQVKREKIDIDKPWKLMDKEIEYLVAETRSSREYVEKILKEMEL